MKHLQQYIVNRSNKALTESQIRVLAKGLKFAPSSLRESHYEDSIARLSRTIRIRSYFHDDSAPIEHPPPFRKKSTWMPPPAHPHIEEYLSTLPARISEIQAKPSSNNLSAAERRTLRALARDQTLVIKNADKGSCIVVENREDYIRDGVTHLSDGRIYQQIPADYSQSIAMATNAVVSRAHSKGHLTDRMRDYLVKDPKEVRTQQAYFLKKIHKDPVAVRPIVSGTDGPTERASSFLDFYLQPEVEKIASHTKDSSSILTLIESNSFDQDIILATIDVRSLYLHIPHAEGIESALQHLFGSENERADIPFGRDLATALFTAILDHNIFEFDGQMYRQIQGTAMGTKMAPAYANLFLDTLETRFLDDCTIKPVVWRRYIDDILCIWSGSMDTLNNFLERLNTIHPTIHFTWETSESSITFLDLDLYKGARFRATGKLDTRLHFKSTNRFQYLPYNSAHPKSVMKGLVKGEMQRALRACSDESTLEATKEKLTRHLRQRGYPRKLLHDIASTILHRNRANTLKPPTEGPLPTQPPAFVCDFHEQVDHKDLREALEPPDPTLRPRISYRRKKNLADTLVRARLPGSNLPDRNRQRVTLTSNLGLTGHLCSTPCRKTNCLCCPQMSGKEVVFDSRGLKCHRVSHNTTCDTSRLIYLLQCGKCSSRNQYVGQTRRPLKERVAGHRAALAQKKNMPLYRHLGRAGHTPADMKFTILELVEDEEELINREQHWIRTLDTVLPRGLNSKWSLLRHVDGEREENQDQSSQDEQWN